MAQDPYAKSGVDYGTLDTFKRAGQMAARQTSLPETVLGVKEVSESRGESCFLLEFPDHYLAFLVEGLGTKNIVADLLAIAEHAAGKEPQPYYEGIGQDAIAMIVNDLATSGAQTLVVGVECAVGTSDWFKDAPRAEALVRGWQQGITKAKALYGPGETPALKDVVMPDAVVLSGAAMGIIAPKERRITGNIQSGDTIIGFSAPSVNANGLTLCRQIADQLPDGYLTKLPSGDQTYGESLLAPTPIYSTAVSDLRAAGLDIHYATNITGHGWRKLMRAKTQEKFSYVIDRVPPIPEIFQFIQAYGKILTQDMFGTYNMGVGYALMVPREAARLIVDFVNGGDYGFGAQIIGQVRTNGVKEVDIPAYNVYFPEESLDL